MMNQETPKSMKLKDLALGKLQNIAAGVAGVADVVMVIDLTGSMWPFMKAVRRNALSFYPMVVEGLQKSGRSLKKLRIKVIAYRDVYVDSEPFVDSGFFSLPEQSEEYRSFVESIVPDGGGDEPESGLEALCLAKDSSFMNMLAEGVKFQRQLIVVMSDASAHRLEDNRRSRMEEKGIYPKGMLSNLDELRKAMLTDSQDPCGLHPTALRLALFTPNAYPWNEIAGWPNVTACWSRAGEGLGPEQYEELVSFVIKSISLR